jgi:thymidine kinase
MRKGGTLHVITGPMFSGKSSELLRNYERAHLGDRYTIMIKPARDTRSNTDKVETHDKRIISALTVPSAEGIIKEIGVSEKQIREQKTINSGSTISSMVICIDEIQFFDPNIVAVVKELINQGKTVYAAGLDLDAFGNPFGSTHVLMAFADTITKLTAICTYEENGERCGTEATMTYIKPEFVAKMENNILPGGKEAFEARCKYHWGPFPLKQPETL